MSRNTVSRWENEGRVPSPQTVIRLLQLTEEGDERAPLVALLQRAGLMDMGVLALTDTSIQHQPEACNVRF